MATPVIKTVKESGGDYTTLAAWQAGEVRDLVAADEIAIAKITGAWTAADSTKFTIAGWTTSATNCIRIYCADDGARHTGKWTSTAYRLEDLAISASSYAYNNTCVGNDYGFNANGSDRVAKNNISVSSVVGDYYIGTYSAASTNNLSSDATAPGLNPIINATVVFVNAADDDYRISVDDTDAKDAGADLSADPNLAFNDDINGKARGSSWCVGADEYLATVITKSVKSSGGDYTSVAAFAVGEALDLVHVGQQITAGITGTGVTDTEVEFKQSDGWYTSKGNYIKVIALNDGARHKGVYNATAYRVQGSGFGGYTLSVRNIWIDGLIIYKTGTAASHHGVRTLNALKFNVRVSNCIIRGTDSINLSRYGIYIASCAVNSEFRFWNNAIYDFTTTAGSGGGMECGGTDNVHEAWVYNNTVIGGIIGFAAAAVTPTTILKNNIVQDATTNYSGTFDGASTNNLDDDGTAPGGASQSNKTLTFKNKAGDNYNLIETDAAVDTGADLGSDTDLPITIDIADRDRCVPWEIGAFEFMDGGEGDDASVALVDGVMRKSDRRRILFAEDF